MKEKKLERLKEQYQQTQDIIISRYRNNEDVITGDSLKNIPKDKISIVKYFVDNKTYEIKVPNEYIKF